MDEQDRRTAEREEREAQIAAVVREALEAVVGVWPADAPPLKEYFPSVSAYSDPPHISVWYFFLMDADLEAAKQSRLTAWADRATREQMIAHGVREDAVADAGIIFVTDEDARRVGSAYDFFNGCGNWYSEPKPGESAKG